MSISLKKHRFITRITVYITVALTLLCSLCGVFLGCSCTDSITRYDFIVFDSNVTVCISGKTPPANMKKDLDALIVTAENCFDLENEDSEISVFNSTLGRGTEIYLSDAFYSVLSEARKYYSDTRNKFNPGIYPLIDLWQFSPKNWKRNAEKGIGGINPPDQEKIYDAQSNISFTFDMNPTKKSVTRTFDTKDTKIDLGGIIKGWLVNEMAKTIKAYGEYTGYISAGGSSIYVLSCDTVSIVHPTNISENIIEVNVKDKKNLALSTSGDYQKYYYDNSSVYTTYCHIIDPDSGRPITTKTNSVTVIAKNAMFADALSTAVCCFNYVPNSTDSPLVNMINEILSNPEYADTIVFAVSSANGGKYVITNAKDGTYSLLDKAYKIVKI